MLLGTGADGHCAYIYPFSDEAKAAGSGKAVLPIDADSKKSITLSIDTLPGASHAILASAKAQRAGMVKKAFSSDEEEFACPAGMIMAAETLWFVDKESVAEDKK